MSATTVQSPTVFTTVLDIPESAEVLNQAIARRVPIQVSAQHAPHAVVWRGTFESGSPDTLVLASVDRWVELPEDWRGVELRATLCIARRVYAFDTRLVAPFPNRQAETITLSRPVRVQEIERRRAHRRRFRASTGVRLYVEGSANPMETTLLNLSIHGLACRADASTARALELDTRVRLAFTLPSLSRPFDLDARIVTTTPGGEGDVVLGLEFLDNGRLTAQRDRLVHALTSGTTADEPRRSAMTDGYDS